MIAGHIFSMDGRCSCGRKLSDIAFAAFDPEWIGQTNIAHTGTLTIHEQAEIASELDRLHDAAMEGAKV